LFSSSFRVLALANSPLTLFIHLLEPSINSFPEKERGTFRTFSIWLGI
jgi:hypothetical protein